MSEQERETEEDEGRGTTDRTPMLPRRPPDCQASERAGLVTRGLGALLLPGRALAGLLLYLLLPVTVFLLALLPAAAIVYLGFLCHSRVHPAPGPRCHPSRLRSGWERPGRREAALGEGVPGESCTRKGSTCVPMRGQPAGLQPVPGR
ncbi:PREDICTED: transmembrane protein 88B [Galeopterus variegatus]|uniref:Transmembrane protein 88B n=1 Tax=Galeopterus variegatus TaxID=482537 RepID=A0ABM0R6Z5_GALVR|nr:PREDICTED: transmembrane protein 88B [Galeopterus variegatus]